MANEKITRSRSNGITNLSSRNALIAHSYTGQENVFGHLHKNRNGRFVATEAATVAFHATFAENKTLNYLSVGSTFPFTSLFIAPMSGIYIFSTSVMSSWSDSQSLHVGVMKNGTYLAGAFTAGDNVSAEQGSVTVATQLQVGEEVWIKHLVHENASLYGGGLTSFMGCLITPL